MTGVDQRTISSTAVAVTPRVLHPDAALVGMVGERLHAVADGGARRLVAGDDEEDEERPELLSGERLALDVGVHELRGDVVGGLGQLPLAELHGELVELHRRRHQVLEAVDVLGVADAEDGVGELEDPAVMRCGDAHHVADDLQRQGGGDLLDEVALSERRDAIDDLARLDAHGVTQARHHLRREAAVDDAAQLGVAGIVHRDHRAEELADLDGHVADVHALARREDVGSPARGPHVVVPGERPVTGPAGHRLELRLGEERDRPFRPQRGERGFALELGPGPELGVGQVDLVDLEMCHRRHGPSLSRVDHRLP